jgi:hypothetical protein
VEWLETSSKIFLKCRNLGCPSHDQPAKVQAFAQLSANLTEAVAQWGKAAGGGW